VIERSVRLRTGETLATRLGDGPLTLAALGVVAATIWTTSRRRRQKT
jgi:apolipoprotein N-acyltransferase